MYVKHRERGRKGDGRKAAFFVLHARNTTTTTRGDLLRSLLLPLFSYSRASHADCPIALGLVLIPTPSVAFNTSSYSPSPSPQARESVYIAHVGAHRENASTNNRQTPQATKTGGEKRQRHAKKESGAHQNRNQNKPGEPAGRPRAKERRHLARPHLGVCAVVHQRHQRVAGYLRPRQEIDRPVWGVFLFTPIHQSNPSIQFRDTTKAGGRKSGRKRENKGSIVRR